MRILITGGTGFIGEPLVETLLARGDKLTLLCRDLAKAKALFGERVTVISISDLTHPPAAFDAVINLAGEPIIDQRWTDNRKQQLTDSRVGLTQTLVQWLAKAESKPSVFISGSAIGYYGNYPEDQALTETALPRECFPSVLCQHWEAAALEAEKLGARVCLLRTGVVLAKHGGALKRMWLPFKLGLGGPIAQGEQWFSWIHLDDMISLIVFSLDNPDISGPINATAPKPVTNAQFSQQLARSLKRPAFLPMPGPVVKLLFGEASELLLEGQKVVPQKLLDSEFEFEFGDLASALDEICD